MSDSVDRRTRAASRDFAFRFSLFFRIRVILVLHSIRMMTCDDHDVYDDGDGGKGEKKEE
jgi:hypothetical protein